MSRRKNRSIVRWRRPPAGGGAGGTGSNLVARIKRIAIEERHTGMALGGAALLGYIKTHSPETWERLSVAGVEPEWIAFLGLEIAGRAMNSAALRQLATGMGSVAAFSLGEQLGSGSA